MSNPPLIHARDYVTLYNQKTVTTLCFKRVPASHAVYLESRLPFNCVGCAAVAVEKYGPVELKASGYERQ
jgi:hypothetical protein